MSDELYEMYYSRVDQRIYWVNSSTNKIEKSWECRSGFEAGYNDYGEPRASLPIEDYTCGAEITSKYGPAYGTFYITTGDPRGRDIHGGGSSCPSPFAPRQGWRVTYGCLRMQNEDGEELSRLMIDHGNKIKLHVIEQHLELTPANTQTIANTIEQPQPPQIPQEPQHIDIESANYMPVKLLRNDIIENIAQAFGATPDKITDEKGNVITGIREEGSFVMVPYGSKIFGTSKYTALPDDDWPKIALRTGIPVDKLTDMPDNKNIAYPFDAGTEISFHQLDSRYHYVNGKIYDESYVSQNKAFSQNTPVNRGIGVGTQDDYTQKHLYMSNTLDNARVSVLNAGTRLVQGHDLWRTISELENNNNRESGVIKDMLKPALTQNQIIESAQHDYTKGESTKLKEQYKALDDELAGIGANKEGVQKMGENLGVCKYLPDFVIRRIDQLKLGDVYHYEEQMAKLEARCKEYNKRNGEYNAKALELQKGLNTPEAQVFIEQRAKEYIKKEQERLDKRPELEVRLKQLQNTDAAIRDFGKALPYSVRDNFFEIKDNPKDPHNLLGQTGQIKIQAETMTQQQQQEQSRAAGVGHRR